MRLHINAILTIDGLLETASSRLTQAGALINEMRSLYAEGRKEEYWRTSLTLTDALTAGGEALTEAHQVMLRGDGIEAPKEAGLLN